MPNRPNRSRVRYVVARLTVGHTARARRQISSAVTFSRPAPSMLSRIARRCGVVRYPSRSSSVSRSFTVPGAGRRAATGSPTRSGSAATGIRLEELPPKRIRLRPRQGGQLALRDGADAELRHLLFVGRHPDRLIENPDGDLLPPLVGLAPRRVAVGGVVARRLLELVDALAVVVVRVDLVVDDAGLQHVDQRVPAVLDRRH